MSINVKGYTPEKISRPTGPTIDPVQTRREEFLEAVNIQIALLNDETQYQGQELCDSDQWWWQTQKGYATDVKFGKKSLTAEGEYYRCKDKANLHRFYAALKKQCEAGNFDEDLEEALRRKRLIQI